MTESKCDCCGKKFGDAPEPAVLVVPPQGENRLIVGPYHFCHACWADIVVGWMPKRKFELEHRPQTYCEVCGKPTDKCVPSPFLPYSGWRCEECQKAHRIPLNDLLGILRGVGTSHSYEERLQEFREWWKGSDGAGPDNGVEYAEKYWLPTMEFFHLTKETVWEKVEEFDRTHEFSAFGNSRRRDDPAVPGRA